MVRLCAPLVYVRAWKRLANECYLQAMSSARLTIGLAKNAVLSANHSALLAFFREDFVATSGSDWT
jgi:hypothetical protein